MNCRIARLLAPPSQSSDLLDHPDIRRMSARELDDLPLPKGNCPEIGRHVLTEMPPCSEMQLKGGACG